MRIRPKTMRRLLILFAGISVICLGIGWVVLVNARHFNKRIAALRTQALSEYQAGDYVHAVDLLGQYLDQSKAQDTDTEALFAYGKSRANVELPRLQHVYEGIQIFQNFLQVAPPGNPHLDEARKLLLSLYVQAEYNQEAVKLADDILSAHPKDVDALRAKVKALYNQRNYTAALAASQKLNEINPFNLAAQQDTIGLMQKAKQSDADLLKYAESLRTRYPDDPRFEVLTAFTCRTVGQNDEAKKWLHAAASRPSRDPDFVAELAQLLDQSEMYADADELIRRAAEGSPSLPLQRMWVQRLWQDGKADAVLTETASLDAAKGDSHLLGYRALALYQSGHDADARSIVNALAHRSADGVAEAWAGALRAKYASPSLPPLQQVQAIQQSISRDPRNPSLRLMLAEAYRAMGETELAIACLRDAVALAPGWAAPHIVAAPIFWQTGRYDFAFDTGLAAVRRAPGRPDAEDAFSLAMFHYIMSGGRVGNVNELRQRLANSQKNGPDAQTLPAYVLLLARGGDRDAAIAAARSALDSPKPLPAQTLLDLADISDAQNLDLGPQLRAQAQKEAGLTPQVALTEARALLRAGKASDGLKLLSEAAKPHGDDPAWDVAQAQFHEQAGDAGTALKEFVSAGDRYPHNLQVQIAIIESRTRLQDRPFWERTINRLKDLTGEQGLVWQAERGRWLLTGPLTEKDKGEAVNLLTEVVHAAPSLPEPHRLLAIALEKVNNLPRAITEWTAAADASHGDPGITGELIRVLVANQRPNDAIAYLDKLAKTPSLNGDMHRWIAEQYVDLGETDKAIALLQADRDAGRSDARRDSELAAIYLRNGKSEEAGKLYAGLLSSPAADAPELAAAADFFASQQQSDQAKKFMDRIAGMKLPPGQADLYQARFAERWEPPQKAVDLYRAATNAAPRSQAAWASLAGYLLRQGQYDDAAAAASSGLKVLPDDNALAALQAHAQTLKLLTHGAPPSGDVSSEEVLTHPVEQPAASASAEYQPLGELLSRDPLDVGGCEMLKAIADVRQGSASADNKAERAREIADKYPRSMALQVQAARLTVIAGHPERAVELARRAATNNPQSAEASRILAMVYVAMGDYFHANEAVQQWRQRSMDNPMDADLMGAQIALQQPRRDPARAIELLSPYLKRTLPQQSRDHLIALYARALIGAGRSDEASRLLQPLLADSARWRITWLDLATAGHKDLDSAADWIRQVAGLIPHDSDIERLALAQAWYGVGAQFDSAQAILSARDLLKTLTQPDKKPNVTTWMAWGLTNQALGELNVAESAYRKALALAPTSPDVQNDLAYLLWLKGREQDLPEAKRLAESAIAAAPENATYYDTLARVQAGSGLQEAAARTFRTALQKDPGSIEAMIGLADLLSKDSTHRAEVKDLLLQVNRLLPTAPPLSKPVRKELEGLRATVATAKE